MSQGEWLTFRGMLKGYRSDMGMTLEQVAQKTGCTRSFICQLEHDRSLPSPAFVNKFVRAMNMSESEAAIWHRLGAKANGWKV